MRDDQGECGCAKCCLPTIVIERDEALAEKAKARDELLATTDALAAAVALVSVLYPPPLGNVLRSPWRERSEDFHKAMRILEAIRG